MNFRTALAWAASGSFATALLRFVSSVAIARLLLPVEVGTYALATSAAAVLGTLRELAGGTYLVQKKNLQVYQGA